MSFRAEHSKQEQASWPNMYKQRWTLSCVLLSSKPDRCAYKPRTVNLIKGWFHNANQIHVQITTAGSGPAVLRAEPHPLPQTRLKIWGISSYRIGCWVVLLLNKAHAKKCTWRFCFLPHAVPEAGSSSKQSSSAMPGRQVAQSSARRQAALIQH